MLSKKNESQTYKIEEVVKNLTIPWGITWLPDLSISSEKESQLIHFKDNSKIEIANVPKVYNSGQGVKMEPGSFIYIAVEGQGIFRLIPE